MKKILFIFIIVLVNVDCTERNFAIKSESEIETKEVVILLNQHQEQILDTSTAGNEEIWGLDSLELFRKEMMLLRKQQREEQRLRMHDVMTLIREKAPGRTHEERRLLIDSVYTAFGLSDIVEKRNKRRKKIENDSLRAVD